MNLDRKEKHECFLWAKNRNNANENDQRRVFDIFIIIFNIKWKVTGMRQSNK